MYDSTARTIVDFLDFCDTHPEYSIRDIIYLCTFFFSLSLFCQSYIGYVHVVYQIVSKE